MMILWILALVLVGLWLFGFVTHVAGNLIHLLLVIAAIVIIYNLVTGMRV